MTKEGMIMGSVINCIPGNRVGGYDESIHDVRYIDLIIPSIAKDEAGREYSVVQIGDYGFCTCEGIVSVEIPESVTFIGVHAFRECGNLYKVKFPESLHVIPCAFNNCNQLSIINIPSSVMRIASKAFYGCGFRSITIPKSVQYIGGGAFGGCVQLKSINVDGENMWYDSIGDILFDKDIKTLVQYPIGKTESEYTVPDSVTKIGDYAFSNSSLEVIMLPDSTTYIGVCAFMDCDSLKSIDIPEGVIGIESSMFENCDSLKSIKIPDSVTIIGTSAFRGCRNLKVVEIGTGVTDISPWAFSNTFLETLKIKAEIPPKVINPSFSYSLTTLIVPKGSKDAYESHEVWGKFGHIETFDSDAAIEEVEAVDVDCEVYTLGGIKVGNSNEGTAKGVYIVRKGSKVTKIVK